ncbi:uncharacterized protein AMSG_05655 [Thecamonas trahens ATCC 50062]|uniref:DBF4-type domain-containing protein n=1 Tax=Thecamonas trahens ATCC 50062 TaxID=461836 RepID=A0A0L0DB99_THETB|nr:hypothetical protein AMSG_05655 [Thecamonas trahens ATCC 50062]KNC49614.1 hypothetical protein AMSG_05655 [Thecamonas trahens ATCC 50062]|eukprot:XP_013757721.1 hypothetical protein AMSG_05655 [Thecamonas trahens ATCC 50062]
MASSVHEFVFDSESCLRSLSGRIFFRALPPSLAGLQDAVQARVADLVAREETGQDIDDAELQPPRRARKSSRSKSGPIRQDDKEFARKLRRMRKARVTSYSRLRKWIDSLPPLPAQQSSTGPIARSNARGYGRLAARPAVAGGLVIAASTASRSRIFQKLPFVASTSLIAPRTGARKPTVPTRSRMGGITVSRRAGEVAKSVTARLNNMSATRRAARISRASLSRTPQLPAVLVEDPDGEFEPFYKVFAWDADARAFATPRLYLDDAHLSTAGSLFVPGTTPHYIPSPKPPPPRDNESSDTEELLMGTAAAATAKKKKKRSDRRPHNKRKHSSKPHKARAPRPGTCECCNVHYDDYDAHITSDKHRRYALNPDNYADLDNLLNRVAESVRQSQLDDTGSVSPPVRDVVVAADSAAPATVVVHADGDGDDDGDDDDAADESTQPAPPSPALLAPAAEAVVNLSLPSPSQSTPREPQLDVPAFVTPQTRPIPPAVAPLLARPTPRSRYIDVDAANASLVSQLAAIDDSDSDDDSDNDSDDNDGKALLGQAGLRAMPMAPGHARMRRRSGSAASSALAPNTAIRGFGNLASPPESADSSASSPQSGSAQPAQKTNSLAQLLSMMETKPSAQVAIAPSRVLRGATASGTRPSRRLTAKPPPRPAVAPVAKPPPAASKPLPKPVGSSISSSPTKSGSSRSSQRMAAYGFLDSPTSPSRRRLVDAGAIHAHAARVRALQTSTTVPVESSDKTFSDERVDLVGVKVAPRPRPIPLNSPLKTTTRLPTKLRRASARSRRDIAAHTQLPPTIRAPVARELNPNTDLVATASPSHRHRAATHSRLSRPQLKRRRRPESGGSVSDRIAKRRKPLGTVPPSFSSSPQDFVEEPAARPQRPAAALHRPRPIVGSNVKTAPAIEPEFTVTFNADELV